MDRPDIQRQAQAPKEYSQSFYSQWERKRNVTLSPLNPSRVSTKTSATTVSAGPRSVSAVKSKAGYVKMISNDSASEATRMLELKIMSSKSAIARFNLREQELMNENMAMRKLIEREEKPEHEAVKKLLRRYEKFRGGMSFLSNNFTETLKKEQCLQKSLEEQLKQELNIIRQQVDSLDAELKYQQNQVHVLNNYKDKEYPVKAIRIAELMTELGHIEIENDDELFDLERIVDSELHKLAISGHKAEMRLKENATSDVLSRMHPTLKEMAKQNQVMEKEIEYHKDQIAQLENDVKDLREEVKRMLLHPKTNVRLQVFPELFKYETKCTPDMDIVLDIPKVKVLPI